MSKKSLKITPVALTNDRNIATRYYFHREVCKINRSKHADRAILSCIDHMQKNHYKASIAEVVNVVTGKLYAVIARRLSGKIEIVYQDDSVYVKDDTTIEP